MPHTHSLLSCMRYGRTYRMDLVGSSIHNYPSKRVVLFGCSDAFSIIFSLSYTLSWTVDRYTDDNVSYFLDARCSLSIIIRSPKRLLLHNSIVGTTTSFARTRAHALALSSHSPSRHNALNRTCKPFHCQCKRQQVIEINACASASLRLTESRFSSDDDDPRLLDLSRKWHHKIDSLSWCRRSHTGQHDRHGAACWQRPTTRASHH